MGSTAATEQQLLDLHAADRKRPAGAGAAAALRSGSRKADHRGRDAGRPGGRHAGERGDSSSGEPALPEPVGGQQLSPLLEQIAVVPSSSVGIAARNAAATGDATLILDSNAQNGLDTTSGLSRRLNQEVKVKGEL